MIDGISEEIQQLIADYAHAVRGTEEQRQNIAHFGEGNLVACLAYEASCLSALHIGVADLTTDAACQKLERDSAEQELLRGAR